MVAALRAGLSHGVDCLGRSAVIVWICVFYLIPKMLPSIGGAMSSASLTNKGTVTALSISKVKGQKKTNIPIGRFVAGHGIEGDAHAGDWHRQVSLLGAESIAKIQAAGMAVSPGDFAENVTTTGLRLWELPIGTRLLLGVDVLLEVTQIGKTCHQRCQIFHQVGDCVMPREGIFARVLKGGEVRVGDALVVQKNDLAGQNTS
jgi:MOSC domain-containing protein YiiM